MANAYKFTDEQIKHIGVTLGAEVTVLEDNENLEVVYNGNLIYFSGELKPSNISVASILVDIFLDDDTKDNEEAYIGNVLAEAKDIDSAENLIDFVLNAIKEKNY